MIEDSVFIGNTINVPNNELYKIKITGNIDPLEPDGTTEIVTKHNSAIYEWIVNDINNRLDYLEFFKLEMNYIDGCGVL